MASRLEDFGHLGARQEGSRPYVVEAKPKSTSRLSEAHVVQQGDH